MREEVTIILSAKGLTKDVIIAKAVECIEESGQPTVSLHELARILNIKPPSLYNHIKNTNELHREIFQYAIDKFVICQKEAVGDKEKDDAIKAFADAYYLFAQENKGLYRLIMSMPLEGDDTEREMAVPLLDSVVSIFSSYEMSEDSIAHWQRVFRAILHGFIAQEDLGYFYYFKDADLKTSRDIAIQCFLSGLHASLEKTTH